jgi:hypothetical protein
MTLACAYDSDALDVAVSGGVQGMQIDLLQLWLLLIPFAS